jgi:multidrug transporter EmrE-like cation transporter
MPPVLDIVIYVLAALLSSVGLFCIKTYLNAYTLSFDMPLTELVPLAGSFIVYLSGLGAWLVALHRNPLSTAYPIGIGLSLASSTTIAILLLGEPLGPAKFFGVFFILMGAIFIGRHHE